jgi:hypothetical protein
MNEQEVKSGKKYPTCSATGARCECGSGCGCGDGRLEALPKEALRWAKSALVHCDIVHGSLDQAIEACTRSRQAPELHEAQRLLACVVKMIEERL